MASTTAKRYCTNCKESGRPAAVTCNGCHHLFCATCIVEHRQEIAAQIDDIHREHRCLQQALSEKYDVNGVLSRINVWEQESIAKIQTAAETARVDLKEWIDRKENLIKPLLDTITNELGSSQTLNMCQEMDLKRWNQQLELQELIDNSFDVDIVNENDAESIVHLIKLKEIRNQQKPSVPVRERFDEAIGAIELSEDGLRAAHLDHIGTNGSACGVTCYSSGIHCIRFQIPGDWGKCFFSGVMTSLQEIISRTPETPSVYGWWDFDGSVINGQIQQFARSNFISKDDELTLTLDCDRRQIELEHHRTNEHVHLSVDLQVCPFPWKFLIGFDWRGGCVRILH